MSPWLACGKVLVAFALLNACVRPDETATKIDAPAVPARSLPTAAVDTVAVKLVCTRLDQFVPAPSWNVPCDEHMMRAAELDGPTLWKLRSSCMINAAARAEAFECNHAHHPDWPPPARGR